MKYDRATASSTRTFASAIAAALLTTLASAVLLLGTANTALAESCYWMKNSAGNPWVPAPQGQVSEQQCFELDSCDGGKGASNGGCYKWADNANAERHPWFYARLSTAFRGDNMCLDVFNGGDKNNRTHLTNCADYSGQYWNLRGTENPGWYRMTTMFRGEQMCLDIFNGGPNNNQPELRPCGNYSGQLWKLHGPDNSGHVRLTTQFRGDNMCLDIFNGGPNNNQPELRGCDNYSGQFWKITGTNKRTP